MNEKTEEYISDLFDPMVDFTFKNIFGSNTDYSHNLRVKLLCELLKLNIVEANIVNTELNVESESEKRGIVDSMPIS